MTNPPTPNQRHHGASASPPSMPTPPTEASLSAEQLLADWRDSIALCKSTKRYGFVVTRPEFEQYVATIDALTTENATLTARVSALEEALRKYGQHQEKCRVFRPSWRANRSCNCGLAAALRGDTGGEG